MESYSSCTKVLDRTFSNTKKLDRTWVIFTVAGKMRRRDTGFPGPISAAQSGLLRAIQKYGERRGREADTARDAAGHTVLNDKGMSFRIMDAHCNDRRMAARMAGLHHDAAVIGQDAMPGFSPCQVNSKREKVYWVPNR